VRFFTIRGASSISIRCVAKAPSLAQATEVKKAIGVGLVGCGGMGSALATAIAQVPAGRLVGFYDLVRDNREKLARQYDGRVHESLGNLLADETVEAVVVATPPDLHEPQVVTAARAGKHVFVEKPMALGVAGCERMIEAAHRAGVTLMVGQVLRYYEPFQSILRWTREGRFGGPIHAFVRRVGAGSWAGSWRASLQRCGGYLYEMNAHELDFLRCLLGEPAWVCAVRQRVRPVGHEIEDVISLLMRFTSGASAHFDGGLGWGRGKYEFNLCFEKLNLISEAAFDPKALTAWSPEGKPADVALGPYQTESPVLRQMRGWLESLRDSRAVPVPGEEGRETIRLVEAAYHSAATGQQVAIAS